MRLGVFLDVDGVLTHKPINMQIAEQVGVEEDLRTIEEEFCEGRIDNEGFNDRLIPLFLRAKFTQDWMRENFDTIQLKARAKELARKAADTYLVSSGPSYYLDVLADRFDIPKERVCCSRYSFGSKGLLQQCLSPVSGVAKGDFVRDFASRYEVLIGVGDNPNQDSSFLSFCNLKILLGPKSYGGYLSVQELKPVIDVIKDLDEILTDGIGQDRGFDDAVLKLKEASNGSKRIFIMTPFRQDPGHLRIADAIKAELRAHDLTGWLATDRDLRDELWSNVQGYLLGCEYGIAVFTAEEPQEQNRRASFNPSVAVELGFMLSRRKPVLLLKDCRLDGLFTDITGFLHKEFDIESAESTVRPAVRQWLESLGLARAAAA